MVVQCSIFVFGNSAFSTCAIAQIALPSGLKTIGDNAFAGQPLTGIKIPASVTSIGIGAFSACESLASVTFEKVSRLESIGQQAFMQTPITALEIPATVKIEGITCKVTAIAKNAFKNNKKLKKLTSKKVGLRGCRGYLGCSSLD